MRRFKASLIILIIFTAFLVEPKKAYQVSANTGEEVIDRDLIIDEVILKAEAYLEDYLADCSEANLVVEEIEVKEYLIMKLKTDYFTDKQIGKAFEQMEENRINEVVELIDSYLNEEPFFSKNTLVSMLEEKGYSENEIDIGLELSDVDWEEQATKASEEYINTKIENEDEVHVIISRKDLLQFLVEEKRFTLEEVTHGLEDASIDWTAQAFKQAQYYLETDNYSEKALVKKLLSAEYSYEEAVDGVGETQTDWEEQAVKKALDFLMQPNISSKENLVDYLMREGFSKEEINYAVSVVYIDAEEEETELHEPSVTPPEVFVPKRPIIIKPLEPVTNPKAVSTQTVVNTQPNAQRSTANYSNRTVANKNQSAKKDAPRVKETVEIEDKEESEETSFFDSPIFIPAILIVVAGNLYLFQKS